MTENSSRPFTAAAFNQYLKEKKLMAAKCTRCGKLMLPPHSICSQCYSDQIEWVELSGQGKLAAFTAIGIGPTFMNNLGYGRDNPYVAGIVELEEGAKISARILGLNAKEPAAIQIGTPVTLAILDQGEGPAARSYLAFQVRAQS